MVQAADQPQVLAAGEVGVDRGELPGETDHAPDGGGLPHHVVPEDLGVPGGRPQDRRQHADRRRLPGPVRPEQPHDGARRDLEAHAVQRGDLAERLAQPGHADRRTLSHLSILPPFLPGRASRPRAP